MPLKLTRAEGERVFVGPDIVIEFCGLNRDGEAILSIDAPRSINVYREEVAQKIASEVEKQNSETRRKNRDAP